MIPDIFETVDLLGKGLKASQLRQDVIANNIANVDTPGFKASHMEFEAYMKDALQGEGGFDSEISVPTAKWFGADDPADVEPAVIVDDSTTMRMDGNNVDIDYEMAALAKNNIYYSTLVSKLTGEITRLKLAIDGR